jgi:hypothetical protein
MIARRIVSVSELRAELSIMAGPVTLRGNWKQILLSSLQQPNLLRINAIATKTHSPDAKIQRSIRRF